ncbi:MAG: hypothetical protein ABI376_04245 [Caulobacteraceae bacterium]
MAIARKDEARALDADERDLVEKSHHPAVQALPDKELADLVKLVRERRDKARDQEHRLRREIRGKSPARGATPATAEEGSKLKVAVLAMAMRRLNNEMERRRRMAATTSMVDNARKALAMKQDARHDGAHFNSRHAREGMRRIASQRTETLVRPMETGRLRKAASVAQAKRDGR